MTSCEAIDWPALRLALGHEVHVWRWRGPRRDPGIDALLAAYLGVPAGQVRWSAGAHGKPCLDPDTLAVNWSHCDGFLLLAVAEGAAVGVDLEISRPLRRREALLERAFTVSERDALSGASDARLLLAWAFKEALVKATGRGIAYGLKRIELDLETPSPRLSRLDGPAGPAAQWQLQLLTQPDEALAAVAYAGPPRTIRQFSWAPATGGPRIPSSKEDFESTWPPSISRTSTS